eukprot:jgi/Psemu1/48103/gm1.48103_g
MNHCGWNCYNSQRAPKISTLRLSRRYYIGTSGTAGSASLDTDNKEEDESLQRKAFYCELTDIVHFYGIIILHGGALDDRKEHVTSQQKKGGAMFSPHIKACMSLNWWKEIKVHLKFNSGVPGGMIKFNYAYKFDYIYETLTHHGVPAKFFHKETPSNFAKKFATVARMYNPVVMMKEEAPAARAGCGRFGKAYRRVHCSFQSIGSCNLGSWGIKMIHSRDLYLKTDV